MVMVVRDEELMLAVAKGDLGAFDELVLRHQRFVWGIAFRFLGGPAEAEDIAQEAFLKLLKAVPRYRPTAGFRTYLYRIVSRLCIDYARKKRPIPTDGLSERSDRSPNSAEALAIKERDTEIRLAIGALPARQRMAVILKYYEGLTYGEIARAMGTTVKAVERLLGRARTILQSTLSHIHKI